MFVGAYRLHVAERPLRPTDAEAGGQGRELARAAQESFKGALELLDAAQNLPVSEAVAAEVEQLNGLLHSLLRIQRRLHPCRDEEEEASAVIVSVGDGYSSKTATESREEIYSPHTTREEVLPTLSDTK